MIDAPALRDELVRIRTGFAIARATGLCQSAYPQSQYSTVLGCLVRETLASDPGLIVESRPSTRQSVHSVGFALPAPCVVWSR